MRMLFKASPARSLRKKFEQRLSSLIGRFVDQDIEADQFRTEGADLCTDFYWDAFALGRSEAGVSDDVDVDQDEAGIVITQIAWATASIGKIIDLLGQPPDPDLIDQALGRVSAIGAAVESLYYSGLASGIANPMYQWLIGGTKEHCADCLAYNGQRHRLRDWIAAGAIPQTFALECHGFKCQCELQASPGREIGTLAPPGMN